MFQPVFRLILRQCGYCLFGNAISRGRDPTRSWGYVSIGPSRFPKPKTPRPKMSCKCTILWRITLHFLLRSRDQNDFKDPFYALFKSLQCKTLNGFTQRQEASKKGFCSFNARNFVPLAEHTGYWISLRLPFPKCFAGVSHRNRQMCHSPQQFVLGRFTWNKTRNCFICPVVLCCQLELRNFWLHVSIRQIQLATHFHRANQQTCVDKVQQKETPLKHGNDLITHANKRQYGANTYSSYASLWPWSCPRLTLIDFCVTKSLLVKQQLYL